MDSRHGTGLKENENEMMELAQQIDIWKKIVKEAVKPRKKKLHTEQVLYNNNNNNNNNNKYSRPSIILGKNGMFSSNY